MHNAERKQRNLIRRLESLSFAELESLHYKINKRGTRVCAKLAKASGERAKRLEKTYTRLCRLELVSKAILTLKGNKLFEETS